MWTVARDAARWTAVGVLGLCAATAAAQQSGPAAAYPSKPIRMIIPFPAGGTTDVAARVLGQKLTETWSQPVIIESRSGAGSAIGTEFVAKAPADGYTLLVSTISFAINAGLRKNPFDPIRDFAPITQISELPLVVVVHPSLPAKNMKELIAAAKARPGQITYASSGSGTSPHLAGEMLNTMANIKLVHVPYKGSALAANDLMGGHVMMNIGQLPAVQAAMQSGRVRALAVTTLKRVPSLPDLPTVAESGVPDYEINSWQGVWAPANTPADILAKLNRELVRAIKLPDVREKIMADGASPVGSSSVEFTEHVRKEIAKWAKVIKESNARAD